MPKMSETNAQQRAGVVGSLKNREERVHKFDFLKRLALATIELLPYATETSLKNFKRYIVPTLKKGNEFGIRAHSLNKITWRDWKIIYNIIRVTLDQKPISFRYRKDLHVIDKRRELFLGLTRESYDTRLTELTARASKPFGSILPQDGDGFDHAEEVASQ